ncbi:MAG: InlB B-repeat-containing protein, partial [Bacillota bacterium]
MPVDQTNRRITIPGDLGSGAGNEFQGWLGQDGTLYREGESFPVNSHFEFYLKERGRYWLTFDPNKGGSNDSVTYTPPQLIYGNETVTVKPEDPVRAGYRFLGWHTRASGNGGQWWSRTDDPSVNRFGGTINRDTKLYARWQGIETSYYVVFWKQSADGESYDYDTSEERTAVTGDTVTTTNADRNKGGRTNSEYGYYFTYNQNESDASAIVEANGSTVLNVYYDRRPITYTFEKAPTDTQSSRGVYGKIGDQYVELFFNYYGDYYSMVRYPGYADYEPYYRTGDTYTPYTGTRYAAQDLSFTGPYGSAFEEWPSAGAEAVWGIGPTGRETTFELPFTVFDPASYSGASATATSLTFHRVSNSGANLELVAYAQTVDGEWEYTEDNELARGNIKGGNYTWTPSETYAGYTIDAYSLGSTEGPWVPVTASTAISYGDNNLYLRYARNPHSLKYLSRGEGTTGQAEETVNGILYGQSLEDYAGYVPDNGREGYTFVGWYEDKYCNIPFDFSSTMGDSDITVYAKWENQRCRVVLDPNAPEGEYSFANNQALTFRIDYNEKIDGANITGSAAQRPGYELDGWYTEDGTEWSFDMEVNEEAPGINLDYHNTSDWTNNVYGDNDGEHNNVNSILKLKAKWKLKVEDNSVFVRYKVDDAYCEYDSTGNLKTVIPVDSTAYAMQEGDTSISFGVMPAPEKYNDGYVFKNWALLNADGTKSGTTYYSGEHPEVDQSFFSEETIVDDSGDSRTVRYVTLKAEFEPKGNVATAVVFDGNGGKTGDGDTDITQSYPVNGTIEMPADDAFAKTGYTLEKWNTKADGSGESLDPAKQYAADNLEGAGWDDAEQTNVLYAQWKANNYKVKFDKNDDAATGTMQDQTFTYDIEQTLTPNGFEKANYEFAGWTTNADGSGDSYTDEQAVKNLTSENNGEITLYAQWRLAHTLRVEAQNLSKIYDATPLEGEAKVWLDGELVTDLEAAGITLTFSNPSSLTNAGQQSYTATASMEGLEPVTSERATLEVEQRHVKLTITGHNDSKTYNGIEQSVTGFDHLITVDNSDGHAFDAANIKMIYRGGNANATAKGIDCGKYEMTLTPGMFDIDLSETGEQNGLDRSSIIMEFTEDLSITNGELTITKANLTITPKAQEYDYDGSPKGENNKTYTGDDVASKIDVVGLQTGDTITSITLNGQETEVGEYDNKIQSSNAAGSFGHTITNPGLAGKLVDNYDVTYNAGKLTITAIDMELKVSGYRDEYDGKSHGVD